GRHRREDLVDRAGRDAVVDKEGEVVRVGVARAPAERRGDDRAPEPDPADRTGQPGPAQVPRRVDRVGGEGGRVRRGVDAALASERRRRVAPRPAGEREDAPGTLAAGDEGLPDRPRAAVAHALELPTVLRPGDAPDAPADDRLDQIRGEVARSGVPGAGLAPGCRPPHVDPGRSWVGAGPDLLRTTERPRPGACARPGRRPPAGRPRPPEPPPAESG